MIDIGITTKGAKKTENKLNEIRERLFYAAVKGTVKATGDTKKYAVKLAHGNRLKNSIKAEIVRLDTNEVVKMRIFNDTSAVPWGSYAEFGTGKYVNNEGVGDAIRLKRAKEIPWYVHESLVPEDFGKYGYVKIGEFWLVFGMRPRPYMKPAAFHNRKANVQAVCDAIDEMVKEVVR